jgi:hypothetical protein
MMWKNAQAGSIADISYTRAMSDWLEILLYCATTVEYDGHSDDAQSGWEWEERYCIEAVCCRWNRGAGS